MEPIALFYNGKDHYQAYVGAVPAEILAASSKPVASGNRGGTPSSVCGHTIQNASCSASSIGGQTKQCRSRGKASSAVGRTPKRSPSTGKAMSNFVDASGSRCSKADTLLLRKRFGNIIKLNQKTAEAYRKKRSQRPGLASSDTCLCGWKVPNKRYQDDQAPRSKRRAHWRDCVKCKGPCPLAPIQQSKATEMRETHSQIAARLLVLAKNAKNSWGHILSEHVVVHGVGRLWKCERCSAVDCPYLMLHANCPKATGPSLRYPDRVRWSVQLRKQARQQQRSFRAQVNKVKRKALNDYKDSVTHMSQANIMAHKKRRKNE